MKNILILLGLLSCFLAYGQGEPITTTRGQGINFDTPTTKNVTPNLFLPYQQVDKISGGKALLNTGNKNMIANAGCEAATTSPWAGTLTITRADADVFGDKHCEYAGTSTGSMFNSVDISAKAGILQGTQGYAEIYVQSAVPSYVGIWVDGVLTSSVAVNPNSKWNLYAIPFLFGTSTASIGVVKTDATNSFIRVDEAYLGVAGNLKQQVSGARLYGTVVHPGGGGSCDFNNASTSYVTLGDGVGCNASTVTGGVYVNTNRPWAAILKAGSPAGTYTIKVRGHLRSNGSASGNYSFWRMTDGTTTTQARSTGNLTASAMTHAAPEMSFTFTYSSPLLVDTTLNLQCAGGVAVGCLIQSASIGAGIDIEVLYFPPPSSIYSAPAPQVGQIRWNGASSCAPVTTSGSFVTLNDADCTYASAQKIGDVQAPSVSGDIALKKQVTAGKWKFSWGGRWGSVNNSTDCLYYFTDGTNFSIGRNDVSAVRSYANGNSVIVEYSSAATVEWVAQAVRIGGTGECMADAANGQSGFWLSLEPISNTITGSFENVVTTSGVSAPKTCHFGFSDGSFGVCTTNPCTLQWHKGSCVSSVTRSTTGTYIVNFNSGYWSNKDYTCQRSRMSYAGAASSTRVDVLQTKSITTYGINNYAAGSLEDAAYELLCIGE